MALGVAAGDIILADHHNALVPITAVKASSTARTSTTTETADPELVLSMRVGTFDIAGVLLVSSAANAAGDFEYGYSWTGGGMTVTMGHAGPHNSLASGSQVDGEFTYLAADSSTPTSTMPYGASIAGVAIPIAARVVVTVAGTLSLIWAQQSSNANATTLLAGSWITAYPVA